MPDIEGLRKDPRFKAMSKADQDAIILELMQEAGKEPEGKAIPGPAPAASTAPRASTATQPVDRFNQPVPMQQLDMRPSREPLEPGLEDVPLFVPMAPGAQRAVVQNPMVLPTALGAMTANPLLSAAGYFGGEVLRQTTLPGQRSLPENVGAAVQAPGVLPAVAMSGVSPLLSQAPTLGGVVARTAGNTLAATGGEVARKAITGEDITADNTLRSMLVDAGMIGGMEGILRGSKAFLSATPPAQRYANTQRRAGLQGRIDDLEQQIGRTEGATLQQVSAYQDDLNKILGEGHQQVETLQGALESYGRGAKEDIAAARYTSKQATKDYTTTRLAIDTVRDQAKREIQTQKVLKGQVPADTAIDAKNWLKTHRVLTEDEIKQLYAEVDAHNGEQLPQSVIDAVDAVYKKAAQRELRKAAIDPRAADKGLIKAGTTPAEQVVPETAEATINLGGRGATLQDTPPTELEIQDLLKQRHHNGRWGVKLANDELFGEFDALLGKAESGSAKLKNSRNGMTTDELAQRAHELGFIDSPDKGELLRALDESIFGGRPVYSKFKTEPEFGFAGLEPQAAEAQQLPATFQGARELLTDWGKKIGILRKAVDMGNETAEQTLKLTEAKYAALQQGLEDAIEHGDLSAVARDKLRSANAAFKVAATHEELADFLQGAMRTPKGKAEEFNPGTILTALSDPKNASLVKKLEEVDMLDGLRAKLAQWQRQFAAPEAAIKKAQELRDVAGRMSKTLSDEEHAQLRHAAELQEAIQDNMALAREKTEATVAGIKMQTEAEAGMKQAAIDQMKLEGEAANGMLKGRQAVLQEQRAAIPDAQFHSLFFTRTPFVNLIARGLMTDEGQRLVGRVMEATGGMNTAPGLIALYRLLKPITVQQTTQERIEAARKGGR